MIGWSRAIRYGTPAFLFGFVGGAWLTNWDSVASTWFDLESGDVIPSVIEVAGNLLIALYVVRWVERHSRRESGVVELESEQLTTLRDMLDDVGEGGLDYLRSLEPADSDREQVLRKLGRASHHLGLIRERHSESKMSACVEELHSCFIAMREAVTGCPEFPTGPYPASRSDSFNAAWRRTISELQRCRFQVFDRPLTR